MSYQHQGKSQALMWCTMMLWYFMYHHWLDPQQQNKQGWPFKYLSTKNETALAGSGHFPLRCFISFFVCPFLQRSTKSWTSSLFDLLTRNCRYLDSMGKQELCLTDWMDILDPCSLECKCCHQSNYVSSWWSALGWITIPLIRNEDYDQLVILQPGSYPA